MCYCTSCRKVGPGLDRGVLLFGPPTIDSVFGSKCHPVSSLLCPKTIQVSLVNLEQYYYLLPRLLGHTTRLKTRKLLTTNELHDGIRLAPLPSGALGSECGYRHEAQGGFDEEVKVLLLSGTCICADGNPGCGTAR